MEVGVFKGQDLYTKISANKTETLVMSLTEKEVITIVVFCESAKGKIDVDRSFEG
jgi:hypothetical protein